MKTCSKCRALKLESDFSKRSVSLDGLAYMCKPCVSAYDSSRSQATEARRQSKRTWRESNVETDREVKRVWSRSNRSKIQNRISRRYGTDPAYRTLLILRARVGVALRGLGVRKSGPTIALLGCTVPHLRAHLESLFKPGMTWENHGPVWHIDHIKPCAAFNLTDPEQQRICFHWTNLQPLFALDNLRKSDNYDPRSPEPANC